MVSIPHLEAIKKGLKRPFGGGITLGDLPAMVINNDLPNGMILQVVVILQRKVSPNLNLE